MDAKKTDFPFDQYNRIFQVSQVLNRLRKNNEKYRILDVGGYGGRTSDFFPNDIITILDVFEVKEPGYVQGDGAKMPFDDNEFDFVLSFDVFEHIESKKRDQFISECTRVTKRAVVCAAPFNNDFNTNAELELNSLHKTLYEGKNHVWLKEHIDYGLPGEEQASKLMKKNELSTLVIGSNENVFWMLMQSTFFVNNKYNFAPKELVELNKFYNNSYDISDSALDIDGNYRKIVYGFKNKNDYASIKKLSSKEVISNKNKVLIIRKIINFYLSLIKYYENENNRSQEELKYKRREVKKLSEEISKIKASKSYLLAKKISKAKNVMNKANK